jgi:hypothetical protein
MTRLLTLVALGLALISTQVEARSKRIHVTVKIVQQTFTGDLANPKLGDQLISSVELFDKHEEEEKVGTGAGTCTIVSVPEPPVVEDTLLQCVLTAVFDKKGQILFGGVAPLPAPQVVATFAILGGTDDFRKVRGEVTLTVISLTLQDAVLELE